MINENNYKQFLEGYTPKYNENSEICKRCGGSCCKSMGCSIFPNDVKMWFGKGDITKDMIECLLRSGYVQLDWWDGDIREDDTVFYFSPEYLDSIKTQLHDRCYYLHMRNKDNPAIFPSWGGRCYMLTDHGCALNWNMRPTGGKSLTPAPHRSCYGSVGKPHSALAWLPYYDIFDDIYRNFDNITGTEILSTSKFSVPVTSIHDENDMRRALGII